MAEGPAPAPRERSWLPVLAGLAAMFVAPLVPPFPSLLPIEQMTLLFIPALAACYVVGWWMGGRVWVAFIWVGVTIFTFWILPGMDGSAYRDLSRAWALLVGGMFGVVCAVMRSRPFLHRGLSTVGLATVVALILSAIGRLPPERAEAVFSAQYALRNTRLAASAQQAVALFPPAEGVVDGMLRLHLMVSEVALAIYPALLGLQALAVCALAWALYHRLNRQRLGPPLGRLRDFTFGDQLVWGLVLGAALALLPALSPLQGVGINLLVFFAALYALRGAAVAAWLLASRGRALSVAVVVAALLAWPVAPAAAFAIGVGDTWFDWRSRERAERDPARDHSIR